MKITKFIAATSAAFALSAGAFAQNATEIMQKFTTIEVPAFSQSTISMDLLSKDGKVEDHRIIGQFGNHKNNLVQTVFDFKNSNTVKGTRVLQAEKENKTDDKWIYMPSLGQVRRVNVVDRKKSFVNCDFTYNDMTIREVSADEHEIVEANTKTTCGPSTYNVWKIKSTPVTKKDVEYSYRMNYIDKETYIPVKSEYYDKNGAIIKVWTVEKIEMMKGATGKTYPIRKVQQMEDIKSGHKTRVVVESMILDKEIPDRYFTQNWLQTGK